MKYVLACANTSTKYSWIERQKYAHKKLIPKKIVWAMTVLRPPLESSWQGESRSVWSIFVKFIFDLFFQNNFPNNAQTKIDHADLNLPRQILVCRGLRPF